MLTKIIAITAAGIVLSGCAITPQPLSEVELAAYAEDKVHRVSLDQEPVVRSISLYEAMARALKYNLDYKIEMYAKDLANSKLNSARFDMLPDLVANSAYAGRSNDPFSISRTTIGTLSTDPSTSRDTSTSTKDITFSWNILDFGLSYVRAKQAADQTLIAEEQKRKVINRVMEDVRTAYWRAVSADRLLSGLRKLEGRTQAALRNSRALKNNGSTSPVAALTYERELIDIKRQTQRLQREMHTSKIQLAALMNLRPGDKFSLTLPKRRLASLKLTIPYSEIFTLALQNRPELREIAYRGRIEEREAKAALLELLPGIQLYAGANYDSNSYLVNNDWISWGAKASWNAMRLFQYPARKKVIDAGLNLNDQRALAMTMAIMTQVQVARIRYDYLRKSATTAAEYFYIQSQIRDKVRTSARNDAASEQTLIREELNTLVASAQYDIAYSDLQNAFASIYSSIGVDPFGDYLDVSAGVNELADALRNTWRERGDVSG
ncbi:MAG: TolC family protein [Rhizobiaceae bacterium]|nr:TolC family protein [Rhizobiaceae bacterium]